MIKDAASDWPTDDEIRIFLESSHVQSACISLRETESTIKNASSPDYVANQYSMYSGYVYALNKTQAGVLLLNAVYLDNYKLSSSSDEDQIKLENDPVFRNNYLNNNGDRTRKLVYWSCVEHDETLDKDKLIVLNNVWLDQTSGATVALKALIFETVFNQKKQKGIDIYNRLKHVSDIENNRLIPLLENIEVKESNTDQGKENDNN